MGKKGKSGIWASRKPAKANLKFLLGALLQTLPKTLLTMVSTSLPSFSCCRMCSFMSFAHCKCICEKDSSLSLKSAS